MARSKSLRAAALAVAAVGGANAALGVDTFGTISSTLASCFKQNNVTFAVARAWHSNGVWDSSAPGAVAAYRAAGIAADVYMFPCGAKDAATQVNSLVTNLHNNNVQFGRIWFDVESNPSTGCGWPSSTATNCAWMQAAVAAAQSSGVQFGTYASKTQWTTIMGSGCSAAAAGPVWCECCCSVHAGQRTAGADTDCARDCAAASRARAAAAAVASLWRQARLAGSRRR